jgi:hypothetical protein
LFQTSGILIAIVYPGGIVVFPAEINGWIVFLSVPCTIYIRFKNENTRLSISRLVQKSVCYLGFSSIWNRGHSIPGRWLLRYPFVLNDSFFRLDDWNTSKSIWEDRKWRK